MAALVFEQVAKCYTLQHETRRSFQELAVDLLQRRRQAPRKEEFWALRDVSFAVEPGETLGIIGENGAGKSTTLKLISRIIEPTKGQIAVNGRVSALLELGAGFHHDLTGRENIFLNASILGFDRKEIRCKIEDIISFAELEHFIDVPVKHYSSGMLMRLGFAVAIHVDPDILLTDEVLAVGDESFQRKCLERIAQLQKQGKTILFVSHSMDAVRSLCTRVLWLHQGRTQFLGDVERVVDGYLLFVHKKEAAALAERQAKRETAEEIPSQVEGLPPGPTGEPPGAPHGTLENRWGSGEVRLRQVRLLDEAGGERFLHISGTPATVELSYEAPSAMPDPIFGIGIYRHDGVWVYGTNTAIDGIPIAGVEGQGIVRFHMPALHLIEGRYFLSAAIHARDETPYDFWYRCWEFSVHSPVHDEGVYRPEHRWEIAPGEPGEGPH